MPTIIGYHDVKDTEHWLASPKGEDVFGPLGVTNIRTFVNPDAEKGWRADGRRQHGRPDRLYGNPRGG
jgi:hypothetical protein